MTYLRNILLGFGILLLAVAILLWFFPARWAVALLAPRLHGMQLQQVSGSVWQGHAAHWRDTGGHDLGRVQWQLSRRALWGDVRLQLDIDGPQLDFSGSMRRISSDTYDWRNVQARVTLGAPWQGWLAGIGQPRGEVRLSIDRARLRNGWPMDLQGTAHWRHGSLRGPNGEIALGDWQLQAQARDGWIKAQFHSEADAPLRGHGQLQGNLLGWRLQATLQPRDPGGALRQWLHRWGSVDADGTVHVDRRGGLAI
ncbi:type II secretion system protein N [Rhodanobacter caeni]|uniref:Type II secretion system protein N n=1 Tax=Rhodanobacter caeni TaxID=657654 RepID=A0ABP3E9C0_9GAMM